MASAVNHVDVQWLADEAQVMAAAGTPRCPAIIGGAGLVGSNLLVLLAKSPGCERLIILDARPPSKVVLSEAGIEPSRVRFVQHLLGTDSEEALAEAIGDADCVYTVVTPHVQFAAESDFYATNVDGVEGLLRACEAKGVQRLVYLSSIAVTNHFVESCEQREEDGLPPMECYDSPYDITKRRGEEMVLAANHDGLRTCALRPGGVLLSPSDFTFSNVLQQSPCCGARFLPKPSGTKEIDFIDGRDVARAMLLASQALEARPQGVAGEAFFCTKGEAADPAHIAVLCKEHLDWPLCPVPACVTHTAICCERMRHLVRSCLGLRVSGVPPHRFMQMAFTQQTFDNSKIQRVLGFHAKVPIAEAVERICEIYKLEHGESTFSSDTSTEEEEEKEEEEDNLLDDPDNMRLLSQS